MIDLGILITGGIGLVTTIVSGWTSYFFTRRKYNTEVDNNLIENMKKSLEFYDRLSDNNRERLEEVLRRNESLEERNRILEKEVAELKTQMLNLMGSICVDLTCQVRKTQQLSKTRKRNEAKINKKVQEG